MMQLADMICGNVGPFPYRSSSYITEFFSDIETDYTHDGTTRQRWVAETLEKILEEPHAGTGKVPPTFARVIQRLMDPTDATDEDDQRPAALAMLNASLAREGFEAYYAPDRQCYLRHVATNTITAPEHNPHRPFSATELERRQQLRTYLDGASEDDLIEDVLLPLFRQMGFHRVTATGHKDKALEYGKDVWMKFTLPTQHVLYFGLQAKKGKLDAAGVSRAGNANVAEIHNQALMMLGHEIFDPEIGKRVLVDHAFIVAGGEITKQARAWIGNALDASQRRSIIFMDRNDILDLYVVNNLPLPTAALSGWGVQVAWPDEPPF
ncbi:restriction endonuclease [Kribbella jiaozuonensis]|nr:restriction endonuclease [Kribbella jiaozuonensis]